MAAGNAGNSPATKGYFGDESGGWRGLCVASVQYAREHGAEGLVRLVMRKHGLKTDYSLYINKTPAGVLRILKEIDFNNSSLGK